MFALSAAFLLFFIFLSMFLLMLRQINFTYA